MAWLPSGGPISQSRIHHVAGAGPLARDRTFLHEDNRALAIRANYLAHFDRADTVDSLLRLFRIAGAE